MNNDKSIIPRNYDRNGPWQYKAQCNKCYEYHAKGFGKTKNVIDATLFLSTEGRSEYLKESGWIEKDNQIICEECSK